MTRVTVLPFRNFPGVQAPSDLDDLQAKLAHRSTLEEALDSPHEGDAYLVAYRPTREDAPHCRINKNAVRAYRELANSGVECTMLIFDIDNPEHAPWDRYVDPQGARDSLQRQIEELPGALSSWYVLYFTRAGARLIYLLDEPVGVMTCDTYLKRGTQLLHSYGIPADTTTPQWTRLYRLPFVVRNGEKTWESDYADVVYRERVVDGRALVATDKGDLSPPERDLADVEEPETSGAPASTNELLYENGTTRMTAWHRQARRICRGKEPMDSWVLGEVPPPPGSRDDTLTRVAGQACRVLRDIPGTSPEHIYALLEPVLGELTPDESTPDWYESLWSKVNRMWAQDTARLAQEAEDARQAEAERAALEAADKEELEVVAEKMSNWDSDPALRGSAFEQIEYMRSNAVIQLGSEYRVLTRHGTYSAHSVRGKDALPALIEKYAANGLIPLTEARYRPQSDEWVDVRRTPSALIGDHLRPLTRNDTRGVVGTGRPGIWLDDRSQPCQGIWQRADFIKPTYSPLIAAWIDSFDVYAEWLRRWIQAAMHPEWGPVCALSIVGPRNCGKSLLGAALAQAFGGGAASGSDIFDNDYSESLLHNPVVHIDEGLASTHWHASNRYSTMLRNMVGNSGITVNPKGRSPVTILGAPRVLITANNDSAYRLLTRGGSQTAADAHAVAERIQHIELHPDRYRDRFDMLLAEDNYEGEASVLHRATAHFLWLAEQEFEREPGRLLVPGIVSEERIRELSASSGNQEDLVRVFLDALCADAAQQQLVYSWEGKLVLTKMQLRGLLDRGFGTADFKPGDRDVFVRNFSTQQSGRRRSFATLHNWKGREIKPNHPQQHWIVLKADRLLEEAERMGHDTAAGLLTKILPDAQTEPAG